MNPRLRCFCDAGPSTRLADVTPSRLPGGRLAAKIERPSAVRVATKPGLAPDAVAAMRTAEGIDKGVASRDGFMNGVRFGQAVLRHVQDWARPAISRGRVRADEPGRPL